VKRKSWITVDGRSRRWRWLRLHLSLISPKNPRRALCNLRALRDEFGESDFCAAYEGKFLLQAGNPEAARKAYADAFQAIRERTDVVGKFIRYVAEGWLAVIDKNPAKAERCFARASKISVSPMWRSANPGPVFDKPDKFDREFDEWMHRHYPDE
jgi:hypothetical protein